MLYTAVLPLDGTQGMLNALVAWLSQPAATARVRLFTNNYAPTPASVPGSFVEADFGGYAALPLGIPIPYPMLPSGRAVWLWPERLWTADGSGLSTILYGFYVTFVDPITSAVRIGWAQRFNSPQGLWTAGQQVKFKPSLGAQSLSP